MFLLSQQQEAPVALNVQTKDEGPYSEALKPPNRRATSEPAPNSTCWNVFSLFPYFTEKIKLLKKV